ncbi:hypothetical protein DPMN_086989 [Dreissena polymorpha]|uniref:Uncharacterized protein n=1 Tax=Dreissena polymorpha TaxID=45954 RepID=A0A9D4QVZ0_DREPO|nr:hypothetical protein DPMN_086989 [Dreissena polymorpha]
MCSIADKVKDIKATDLLEDVYSNFKRQRQQLNEQKLNRDEWQKKLNKLKDDCPNIVKSHRSKLDDILNEIENDTIQEFVKNVNSLTQSVYENIDECDATIEELVTKEESKDNLRKMNAIHYFITQYDMKAMCSLFEKQLERLTSKVALSFYPNTDIADYLRHLNGLGKVECTGIRSDLHKLFPDQILDVEQIETRNIKVKLMIKHAIYEEFVNLMSTLF